MDQGIRESWGGLGLSQEGVLVIQSLPGGGDGGSSNLHQYGNGGSDGLWPDGDGTAFF